MEYNALRIYDGNDKGSPLIVPPSDANIPELRVQTPDGKKAYHNPSTNTESFSYTGSVDTWTAPSTIVGTATFTLLGGGGGGGGSEDGEAGDSGQDGGKIVADVDVSPGQTVYIYVAQKGFAGIGEDGGGSGGFGAHNGSSGNFNNSGGGGGGAGSSEIRIPNDDDADAILSAGGGDGGDGADSDGNSGNGGQHASEGNDGLVVDGTIVTNSTTTKGGGANGGDGGSNGPGDDGSNGSISVEYIA